MAKADRLDGFSSLRQLNEIVVRSKGAYTHEQAYEIEADFANSLSLMYYETEMFERRYADASNQLKATNKLN